MNIGFDAKRLFTNFTGLGNYSRTLVKNLQKYYPEHQYHLYTDRITENEETKYFLDKDKFTIHQGPKYFKSLWRSKFLVKDLEKDGIDIYHGLSNELPFGIHHSKVKSVVTIHDLIFKAYPKQYKMIDRKIYHLKSKYAVNNSNKIVSISHATSKDLFYYYLTPKEKIQVIYQSCAENFKEIDDLVLDLKPAYSLPDNYFLYVGSIIERKGLLNLAKAMNLIPLQDRLKLVVVGRGSRYLNRVKQYLKDHQMENDFIFLKGVSNNDLAFLYKNASAFIYPSLKEGFGIPIIEAGLMNTPIISSNRSSLVEAGGPHIIQVDPEQPEALSSAMLDIINGYYDITKTKLVKAYIHQHFDERKLTKELMDLYLDVFGKV